VRVQTNTDEVNHIPAQFTWAKMGENAFADTDKIDRSSNVRSLGTTRLFAKLEERHSSEYGVIRFSDGDELCQTLPLGPELYDILAARRNAPLCRLVLRPGASNMWPECSVAAGDLLALVGKLAPDYIANHGRSSRETYLSEPQFAVSF